MKAVLSKQAVLVGLAVKMCTLRLPEGQQCRHIVNIPKRTPITLWQHQGVSSNACCCKSNYPRLTTTRIYHSRKRGFSLRKVMSCHRSSACCCRSSCFLCDCHMHMASSSWRDASMSSLMVSLRSCSCETSSAWRRCNCACAPLVPACTHGCV